jgi:SAM-dependent methyltransferase
MKSRETLIDSYNQLARVYAEKYCGELDRKPFDCELLERFVLASPPGQPICDLGCGPGHLANFLKGLKAEAIGIDLSPAMIETAKGKYPSIDYRVGDMLNLDLPADSLGGIVAFYCIIHLRRNQLETAFAGMRRVLAPGGGILVSFHEGSGEHHEDESLGMPIAFDCSLFEPEEVAEAMSRAQLTVKEINTRPPYDFEFPTTRVYIWAVD